MEWEALARLGVAALFAAAIGIDRELRSKPAGLRTNIVVSVAAAAFAYLGSEAFGGGDPTRVASQVVSGIGFLGGGAIFAAGGKPHGLTTAAALWGSAAIGIAAGMGQIDIAVAVVIITLAVLWPLDVLSGRLLRRIGRRDVHVQVIVDDRRQLQQVQAILGPADLRVVEAEIREIGGGVLLDMVFSGRGEIVSDVLDELGGLPDTVIVANLALSPDAG